VCGSAKLYNPSSALAMAVAYSGAAVSSAACPIIGLSTKLMNSPATIQPMVPKTRMSGNCFS